MYLESEKEYLLKAVDSSQRIFIIVSPEFRILVANSFTKEKFGQDLVGKICHEAFCCDDSVCKICPAAKALKSKKPAIRNTDINVENYGLCNCRYSYPIFSNEKVEALAILEIDLPSKEEMEEKLQLSNAFLKNLLLSSVDAVMAADKIGKVILFNDAASEISGYSVEEALENLDIRDVYQPGGAKKIMKKLRSDDNGGKGKLKSMKIDVVRKDGEIIPIMLNAAIVYEGKKEIASIGFFHDMRDELKMRSKLEKTQIQLIQAEKMSSLGKLAAGVAHQLNNPLGGITLFSKLILEEYELEKGAEDDLNRIVQDAERCRDTVKELLEFARQTSQMKRPHDINESVARTLFLLENQALFQNIEIRKNFRDGLPKVSVDIQQMNHVFMNIILNAAQAMDGRGILEVRTCLSGSGENLLLEISDTGPGMDEETLSHIFEPFFTTKDEGKGTGLGLSMVYGIIEDHGGRIKAKSEMGKGTSFIIELPIKSLPDGIENDG